jgi:hypothetical protein
MMRYHIEYRAVPGSRDTGGFAPGWHAACGKDFESKAAAEQAAKKHRKGVQTRVRAGGAPLCETGNAMQEWLTLGAVGAMLYLIVKS